MIFSNLDFFWVPLCLWVVVLIGIFHRRTLTQYPELHKLYWWALFVRVIGGASVGVIYFLYYGGGDTTAYYRDGLKLNELLFSDFELWKRVFFQPWFYDYESVLYDPAVRYQFRYLRDQGSFLVARLVSVFLLPGYGSYLVVSMLIGLMSFWATTLVAKAFYGIVESGKKLMVIGLFFTPSVFFWGSGILKDSFTYTGLCLCFYAVSTLIIAKNLSLKHLFLFLVGSFLMFQIKPYIYFAFLAAMATWIGIWYGRSFSSPFLRNTVGVITLFFFGVMGFLVVQQLGSLTARYSIDNVLETAAIVSDDLNRDYYYTRTDGSAYQIGAFDPTPQGVLSKMPIAVWTAYFRPYPWEAKNPLVLMASLESTALLVLFLLAIRARMLGIGIRHKIKYGYPVFAWVFVLFFGFAVGLTAGNFGNLVRYKIPMMPFLSTALLLAAYRLKIPKQLEVEPPHVRH